MFGLAFSVESSGGAATACGGPASAGPQAAQARSSVVPILRAVFTLSYVRRPRSRLVSLSPPSPGSEYTHVSRSQASRFPPGSEPTREDGRAGDVRVVASDERHGRHALADEGGRGPPPTQRPHGDACRHPSVRLPRVRARAGGAFGVRQATGRGS